MGMSFLRATGSLPMRALRSVPALESSTSAGRGAAQAPMAATSSLNGPAVYSKLGSELNSKRLSTRPRLRTVEASSGGVSGSSICRVTPTNSCQPTRSVVHAPAAAPRVSSTAWYVDSLRPSFAAVLRFSL